jgi:hypothetical protein
MEVIAIVTSRSGVRSSLVQRIAKRKDSFMRPTIVVVHGAFADASKWEVET